ncbi:MAG: hypothetical protein JXA33_26810 [Anaerolineae bacterium]|nr:hypothetical protein [Anaerolineae bacterium]
MRTYPIYLWPRGTLASRLSSDTLFGAVCWAIRILGLADVGKWLETFNAQPAFAFSAPFPVVRTGTDTSPVRFYPRPFLPPLSAGQVNTLLVEECQRYPRADEISARMHVTARAKHLKHKAYLSEALFTEVVNGNLDTMALYRRYTDVGTAAVDIETIGSALLSYPERQQLQTTGVLSGFVREDDVQHNQVDRVTGATVAGALFFEHETYFRPRCGLWCVLRTDADTLQQRIAPALRYLADTGLGANRTTGKGHFDIVVGDPFTLPISASANSFISLSHYLPRVGEWPCNGEPLHYDLHILWPKRESKFVIAVPGERTPPVRKRRLRMFAPGSVFPLAEQREVYGQLVQAVPPSAGYHTVWQSGLTIPVFARVEVQHE